MTAGIRPNLSRKTGFHQVETVREAGFGRRLGQIPAYAGMTAVSDVPLRAPDYPTVSAEIGLVVIVRQIGRAVAETLEQLGKLVPAFRLFVCEAGLLEISRGASMKWRRKADPCHVGFAECGERRVQTAEASKVIEDSCRNTFDDSGRNIGPRYQRRDNAERLDGFCAGKIRAFGNRRPAIVAGTLNQSADRRRLQINDPAVTAIGRLCDGCVWYANGEGKSVNLAIA